MSNVIHTFIYTEKKINEQSIHGDSIHPIQRSICIGLLTGAGKYTSTCIWCVSVYSVYDVRGAARQTYTVRNQTEQTERIHTNS